MSVEIELVGDTKIVADFGTAHERVGRAARRALNRGLTAGRALMAGLIAKEIGIKVGEVRDKLPTRIRLVGDRHVEGLIATNLQRLRLMHFGAKGPVPSRGKGAGVTWRMGARGRQRLPNAFIATFTDGGGGRHQGVFVRKGRARMPIKQKYGPSLGHIFARYRPQGLARAREQFEKTLDHELARALAADAPATISVEESGA